MYYDQTSKTISKKSIYQRLCEIRIKIIKIIFLFNMKMEGSFERDIVMNEVEPFLENSQESQTQAFESIQSQSLDINMSSKNESAINSSIKNVCSVSQTPKEDFELINQVAESVLLSNIGIKVETKVKTNQAKIIEGIVNKIIRQPKIKPWFYEALYKNLSKIVKEDNIGITVDQIDKEIKTLHDNKDIKELTIKDIFLYKYKNGMKLYEGNNKQLLELLNNNQATDKILNLLKKKYLAAFTSFISIMAQHLYEEKRKNQNRTV